MFNDEESQGAKPNTSGKDRSILKLHNNKRDAGKQDNNTSIMPL